MQYKALILTALLVLTSTPAFAAPFADVQNVDKPQFVATDDYDDDGYRHNRRHYDDDNDSYRHNRRHDYDDDNGYGHGNGQGYGHNRRHGYDD